MSSDSGLTELLRQIEGEGGLISRLRRVVRFAVPFNAKIAVVSLGDDRLLDVGGDLVVQFPRTAPAAGAESPTPQQLIEELDDLREQGFDFLLIPSTSLSSLDAQFRDQVSGRYRMVREEEDSGIIFSLREVPDLPEPEQTGPDGLPMPPPEMIRLTFGLFGDVAIYEPFYSAGVQDADSISKVLERNQLDISQFEAVLDFGCGCGRVIRQWKSAPASLHGSDFNPYLIEWCERNLPFGEFRVNDMTPPLSFKDNSFDFIYVLSVFTHIVEPLQIPWVAEMARVLRPGGFLLMSVNGEGNVSRLPDADQEVFRRGELLVKWTERAGTNACTAFHPEAYLRTTLASNAGLEFLDLSPAGVMDNRQDAVLLRKPI